VLLGRNTTDGSLQAMMKDSRTAALIGKVDFWLSDRADCHVALRKSVHRKECAKVSCYAHNTYYVKR
jgi:hypothetical protein